MRWVGRNGRRESQDESLAAVRRIAEEDVLHLGEELARFDRRTAGSVLDEDGRVELQTALDAYEGRRAWSSGSAPQTRSAASSTRSAPDGSRSPELQRAS